MMGVFSAHPYIRVAPERVPKKLIGAFLICNLAT